MSDRNEMLVKISRLNLPFKFVHIPSIDGKRESQPDNVTLHHPPGLSPVKLKAKILSVKSLIGKISEVNFISLQVCLKFAEARKHDYMLTTQHTFLVNYFERYHMNKINVTCYVIVIHLLHSNSRVYKWANLVPLAFILSRA